MRSFEERKAEILRRSNARIRARKKRRVGALLCCIPMFVCVTFFAVMILPAMMPAGSAAPDEKAAQDSLFCADILVEIETDGYCRQYTDQNVIVEISNAIHAVTNAENDPVLGETPAETTEIYLSDSKVVQTCTVTFTDREGNTTAYVLTERSLYAKETETTYALTNEQSAALRQTLGLDERK